MDNGDLHVFLNYTCQAKCPFCYNPPLTAELNRWKLPMETLAQQLLRQRKAGSGCVTFSGGEVTLLQELPAMIRLSRKAGYDSVGIISNGIRLAQAEYFEEIKQAGLSFCCLSVHAGGAELHDQIVAVPGAFRKILKALDHLENSGVPYMLNFVLTRRNFKEAPAFVKNFAARKGLAEIQIYYPHYDGLMALNASQLKLSMQEAGPWITKALETARELGAAEKLWFYNFPPCAVPETLRDRLRNWEREPDSMLLDPRAADGEEISQERRDRVKTAECKKCSLNDCCLGYERAYIDMYGDSGIRALK